MKEVLEDTQFGKYSATVDETEVGFIITNRVIVNTKDISVEKVWEDEDYEGFRPESITVNLLADGEKADELVLGEENGWKGTFADLPEYVDGQLVAYTVEEADLVSGFEYDTEIVTENGKSTITNTIIIPQTSVSVTKVWNDELYENYRPEEISVVLVKDGVETDTTAVLGEENQWSAVFENLPEYENGEKVEYTVKEVIPENSTFEYDADITGSDGVYTITNTIIIPQTSVYVQKVWDDEGYEEFRPEGIDVVLLADGAPTQYTITLTAENGWAGVFNNVPVYDGGTLVSYTVEETGVDYHYEAVYSVTDGVRVITNTYVPDPVYYVNIGKIIDGAGLDNKEFTFAVEYLFTDGEEIYAAEEKHTALITGEGNALVELVYGIVADTPVIAVYEVEGELDNCEYDDTVWLIALGYNEDGVLTGQLFRGEEAVGEAVALDGDYVFDVTFTNKVIHDNPETGDTLPVMWAGLFVMSVIALCVVSVKRKNIQQD